MSDKEVRTITKKEATYFIINIHYLHRFPSMSFIFGLFENDELIGVCTYGKPPSYSLQKGICGKEYSPIVWELNRLVLKYNRKNEASYFIGQTFKLLPKPIIIVSFADPSQSHLGIIYQATNFIYTGLSAKRTNWVVKGKENLHGITIADEFRGVPNRSQAMRDKYGNDFTLVERVRKHRYIKILGSKTDVKKILKTLKYKIYPYPKVSWDEIKY